MKVVAIDDEQLALEMLADAITKAAPDAELAIFRKTSEFMEYVQNNKPDVAFLDIKMRGMTGIELAMRLKNIAPMVNIIFVTGYDEYTGQAMQMHASGYIYKPVTPEKVRLELDDLRNPVMEPDRSKAVLAVVKCFGNFEVFTSEGETVKFERAKSKEALAYLISRDGASCTVGELAGVIFENEGEESRQKSYARKIISSMINSLKKYHIEDIVNKDFNSIAVNPAYIKCDYYDFQAGDVHAINNYHGEFMLQYSWAEFITGYLDNNVH